jgi:outer membrane protein assembly factor BamB
VCAPGRADDWAQFRRDQGRTAASTDPVPLPLTDIWTWNGEVVARHSGREREEGAALSTVALWNGRAYFVSGERAPGSVLARRSLVCANAFTGTLLWKQPLGGVVIDPGLLADIGPVVSPGGAVFVHDWLYTRVPPSRNRPGGLRAHFVVRAFLADGGSPMATAGGPLLGGPFPTLLEIRAGHGHPDQFVLPTGEMVGPADPFLTSLGHPLLAGNELLAADLTSLFCRWLPGQQLRLLRIAHAFPTPTQPRWMALSMLSGYPSAASMAGVVLGDDQTHRFLTVLDEANIPRWHWDVPWTLGIPSMPARTLFSGVGGPSATAAIVAVDAATGTVRWYHSLLGLQAADRYRWLNYPPDNLPLGYDADEWQPQTSFDRSAAAAARRTAGALSGPDGGARRPPGPQRPAAGDPSRDPGLAFSQPRQLLPRRTPRSDVPPGHRRNPGLVIARSRVYGQAGNMIVALDQATGAVQWRQPLPIGTVARSLAASRDHLFVSFNDLLVAYRLDNGQPEWARPMPMGGVLSLANGLVLLANREPKPGVRTGGEIHALAPAERTYALAIDSDRPQDYRQPPPRRTPPDQPEGQDAAASEPPVTAEPPADGAPGEQPAREDPDATPPEPPVSSDPPPLADASLLRLEWQRELPELLAQARARREAAGGAPVLLVMEWLDRQRAGILGTDAPGMTTAQMAAFTRVCAQVAAVLNPAYVDVGPEVNVYLARYPGQSAAVLELVRRAREAVRRAAPGAQVLVSLNVEVLNRRYGSGRYRPFGELALRSKVETGELAPILAEVDAVGLTSHPQSAFTRLGDVPGDYLLAVRARLLSRPILMTRSSVLIDGNVPPLKNQEPRFLRRLLQLCYWLDAQVVAYPEVATSGRNAEWDPLVADPDHPALGSWQDVLTYRRVSRLALRPGADGVIAPGSEPPAGAGGDSTPQ